MKRNILLATLIFAAGSLLADSKDDVSNAVKALTDGGNFSWTSTVENANGNNGFGGGPSEGKTANGMVYTSRTFGDNTFETVVKGTNFAMNRGDGWQTAEEMAQDNGGGGGGFRGGGNMARFAGATPAMTLTDVLTNVASLKESGGGYMGDLTEEGAKAQASPFGRGRGGRGGGGNGGGGGFTPPAVTDAKGSVSIWLKDGKLSKYVIKVTGKTTDRNGDPADIDRTTTVEIKDVGSTKLNVPADVVKKIGG